tara:strand:+ start:323 stop:1495 length:1173 start_codon:yes stop_codon:yes gene_type:complete
MLIIISLIFLFLSFKVKYNFLQKKYNIFLLIFFSYIILLNLILNQNNEDLIKSFFLLKFFFLFNSIIFVYSRIDKKFLIKNLNYLLISILIISIDFFTQYIIGHNLLGFKPHHCDLNFENCQRYSGLFGSELVLGGYFSTIIFSLFLLLKILKKNSYINLLPIFILIIVFLSGERSAFLLSFIFLITFYLLIIKFNMRNIISIFFIISILITSINFLAKDTTKARYYSDIKSLLNFDQPSLIETLKLTPWGLHYDASISIILDKPLFGNGLKSFRVKCKKYEVEEKEIKGYRVCSTHPHNFHLEILIDTGLLGYLLFLMFVFYIIKDLKKENINKNLMINFIIFFIIIFIFLPRPTGSVFSTFFGAIFWYFLGSLFGYSKLIKSEIKNFK